MLNNTKQVEVNDIILKICTTNGQYTSIKLFSFELKRNSSYRNAIF